MQKGLNFGGLLKPVRQQGRLRALVGCEFVDDVVRNIAGLEERDKVRVHCLNCHGVEFMQGEFAKASRCTN